MDAGQRRRLIIVAIAASIICLLLTVFGVIDIPHAIVVVAISVMGDALMTADRGSEPEEWPLEPIKFRSGARREVAQLAWATVGRDGKVAEPILRRVRELARQMLADYGVRWSGEPGTQPEPISLAQQLLGKDALRTLTTTEGVRPRALVNAVTKLEELPMTSTEASIGKLK